MSEKTQKYRLFMLQYSPENVMFASGFRFSRVTADYILVYDRKSKLKPANGNVIEVRQEEVLSLSDMDKSWLLDCARSIFMEDFRRNQALGAANMATMLDRLEKELEKEANERDGEGV